MIRELARVRHQAQSEILELNLRPGIPGFGTREGGVSRDPRSPTARSHSNGPGSNILTIEEVAEILRCSKAHVSKALSGKVSGVPRLTHLAGGRRKLVRREWLDEWLEANKKR